MENQINLILRYKKEEKAISYIPENFSELKDLFLSNFDEKNDKIYLFKFKRKGDINKTNIQKNDLFNDAMQEIVKKNYKIFIRAEDEESDSEDSCFFSNETINSIYPNPIDDNEQLLKKAKSNQNNSFANGKKENKENKSESKKDNDLKEEKNEQQQKINDIEFEKLKHELNELKENYAELNLKYNFLKKCSDKKVILIEEYEQKFQEIDNEKEKKKLREKIEKLEKKNKQLEMEVDSYEEKIKKYESENKNQEISKKN